MPLSHISNSPPRMLSAYGS